MIVDPTNIKPGFSVEVLE